MAELARIDLKPILEDIAVESGYESSAQLDSRDTANRDVDNHVDGLVNGVYTLAERTKIANVPADTASELGSINTLLTSDDTTLDELQEIVTFIKANRSDLDAITLDNIVEGVTNKYYTLTEKDKLAGIEVGATADQTDTEVKIAYDNEYTQRTTSNYIDAATKLDEVVDLLDTQAKVEEDKVLYVTPGVNTDPVNGVGTVAVDGSRLLVCTDATAGANVWTDVTAVVDADTRTFTNKTLIDPSNQIHARIVEYQVKAAAAEIPKGAPVTINEWDAVGGIAEAVVTNQSIATQYGIANAVAAETIVLGAVGTVIVSGTLSDLNTESYVENQVLFVDGGVLTNVEPTSGWVQPIAKVLRGHATEGVIQVQAQAPKQDASDVRYDNTTSGLSAVNVQGVIDELTGTTEW